ncbi:hypothetical protein OEZ49_23035, partial [Ruegeria sp. WL0004]
MVYVPSMAVIGTFSTFGDPSRTGANGPFLTFITGRDAAMQLSRSGRSCIAQHFFDGNDRVADKADKADKVRSYCGAVLLVEWVHLDAR